MTTPAPPADRGSRSPKGEQTAAAIAQAAQELFLERGYEKTTMRAIADHAGVSLGNAYYYFSSKEHLVQAFYNRIQDEHEAAAEPVLAASTDFETRLAGVLLAWVDVAEPLHAFAAQFFRVAADPASPLSPFSEESEPARAHSIATYQKVVDGSTLKLATQLRTELPRLLWLLQMGVVLFWVYDRSEGQQRTRTLVTSLVPIIGRLLRLTRVPGVTRIADDITALVRTLSR